MPTGNPIDWISLNLLPGMGPILAARALKRFGDPGEIAHRVPVSHLVGLRGAGPSLARASADAAPSRARPIRSAQLASEVSSQARAYRIRGDVFHVHAPPTACSRPGMGA